MSSKIVNPESREAGYCLEFIGTCGRGLGQHFDDFEGTLERSIRDF